MQMGRVVAGTGRVCGHRGRVTDIKWNPFSDNIIASGSDDSTVRLVLVFLDRCKILVVLGWQGLVTNIFEFDAWSTCCCLVTIFSSLFTPFCL